MPAKLINLLLLLVATATTSFGTCADFSKASHTDQEFQEKLDGFRAIFLGKVLAAVQRDDFTQTLRVRTLRTWKGTEEGEVIILFTGGDEEYGFPSIGTEEIFYVRTTADGTLTIPHCGKGNWHLDERMKSYMGQGREISFEQPTNPEQETSFWSWLWEIIRSPFR